MMPFTNPTAVVLSTCMGLGGWGFPSSSSVILIGKASLTFRKVAPISASDAKDMKALMSWHRVWMSPWVVGRVGGLSQFLTSWLARKNGLRIGCVHVLHRYRMHRWQRG